MHYIKLSALLVCLLSFSGVAVSAPIGKTDENSGSGSPKGKKKNTPTEVKSKQILEKKDLQDMSYGCPHCVPSQACCDYCRNFSGFSQNKNH